MNFTGQWYNAEGNVLVIKPFGEKRCRVRYIRKDGRLLFWNRVKLFIHMFPFGCIGKIENDCLIIDLAGPLGPALELKISVSEADNTEILLPRIIPSISDGWEDVIGITWLQPLSPFRRIV